MSVFVEPSIFVEIFIAVFTAAIFCLGVAAVIKNANDKEWAEDQRMLAERDRHLQICEALAALKVKQ
jgi:hypothetical protein